jgi:hypothetical protein
MVSREKHTAIHVSLFPQVVQKEIGIPGAIANPHDRLRIANRWNVRCTLIPSFQFTTSSSDLDPEQCK